MLAEATRRLRERKDEVNALNVFPVPDGDTGHNMVLTLEAALAAVEAEPGSDLGAVSRAAAQGALRGARGNSGVILSQLLRGMAEEFADAAAASGPLLARALQEAAHTAYRMVMRPVEGTILTVARAAAEGARAAAHEGADPAGVLAAALAGARQALARTPELLPVLKRAGVVDAGGQGLVFVLEGMLAGLDAAEARVAAAAATAPEPGPAPGGTGPRVAFRVDPELSHIAFPYDVELVLRAEADAEALRRELDRLGDSVLVIPGEGGTKVHVHTDRPGQVLELCQRYGELADIHILNMRLQYQELLGDAAGTAGAGDGGVAPARTLALVAVAPGEGLAAVLRSLGVDEVVPGGQSMNPSAEEIARAVERTGARQVIVLPNNPNVLLACRQAAELTPVPVAVVPSRTVPQGVAAALAYHPERPLEENVEAMTRALDTVRSGAVTYAVRDAWLDGREVRAGQVIGLDEERLAAVGDDPDEVLARLLERMLGPQHQVVTVYCGEMIEEERLGPLAQALAARLPAVDVEVVRGGQPHYFYLVAVE